MYGRMSAGCTARASGGSSHDSITIALDDAQATRLQRFADQRRQTLEQALQSLLAIVLPDVPRFHHLSQTVLHLVPFLLGE